MRVCFYLHACTLYFALVKSDKYYIVIRENVVLVCLVLFYIMNVLRYMFTVAYTQVMFSCMYVYGIDVVCVLRMFIEIPTKHIKEVFFAATHTTHSIQYLQIVTLLQITYLTCLL